MIMEHCGNLKGSFAVVSNANCEMYTWTLGSSDDFTLLLKVLVVLLLSIGYL